MTQQNSVMKKKPMSKKFEKIDAVEEKSILPEDLKNDLSSIEPIEPKKFKPSRKWLAKLKQGRESIEEKLTPDDFIQLIEE